MKDVAKYSNKYVDLYYELMVETVVRFGGDRQNSSETAKEVVKFETELAKVGASQRESFLMLLIRLSAC